MEIKVERAKTLKEKPDQSNLGFGKYFTDHMFVYDWDSEKGWHDARIVPYAPIQMDPATMVLHYAQETFEGLKAYRNPEGNVQLFRPEMNAKRMRNSNKRLCMAELPEEDFVEAVETLVKYEQDWIPTAPETSLYIRPLSSKTKVFPPPPEPTLQTLRKYITVLSIIIFLNSGLPTLLNTTAPSLYTVTSFSTKLTDSSTTLSIASLPKNDFSVAIVTGF